jgi:hypothetical protein
MGANPGVKVGHMLTVIRPRGRVEVRWTKKKNLGFYVQKAGAVEVVNVKAEVSAARIVTSGLIDSVLAKGKKAVIGF